MKRKDNMPAWVYWGLWGIRTRRLAMLFVVFSMILSLIIVPSGVATQDFVLIAFAIVPLWYWLSVRWVDANSSWDSGNTP